jgi:integrase
MVGMSKLKEQLKIGEQRNGIWRRSADTYLVRMMINGKRQYINAGDDYQAAILLAQDAKKRRQQEKLTGRSSLIGELFKKKSNITLGELIERYIEIKQLHLKQSTISFYNDIKGHLEPLYIKPVDKISLTEISLMIKDLQNKKLSAKTINHILTLARSVCTFGIKENLIENNPFSAVENLRVPKHEPNPFTKDELKRIFANLDKHLLPYFILQVSTGIRSGELAALRWKDIDWPHHQIHINKNRWKGTETTTKTKESDRRIPFPPNIGKMLKDLQKARKAASSAHIVINKKGKPYVIYLHKYWKQALKAAKVPYRQPYVLRSTFGSMMMQAGADLAYTSKTMGHTSIKMTADKYLRYLKDADKQNKEKQEAMVNGFLK